MKTLTDRLLAGGIAEFSLRGKEYLIQQENNKGWNYLSLWRTAPDSVCLGRAFFDIFDGVSEDTVLELLSQPCIEGRSLQELLREIPAEQRLTWKQTSRRPDAARSPGDADHQTEETDHG